jgi:hypothetical protein
MRSRGITKPDFRPSAGCLPCCQAPFYLYARWLISDQPEGTIGRLRYILGGDRPSQTAQLKLSLARIHGIEVSTLATPEWYLNVVSRRTKILPSKTPTYPAQT